MLSIFSRNNIFSRNKQLLDEDSIQWIFATFEWAISEFDSSVFFEDTVLVLPDNEHFPGAGSNSDEKANLILERVKEFASMAHWPTVTSGSNQPLKSSIHYSSDFVVPSVLRGKNVKAGLSDSNQLNKQQSNDQQSKTPKSFSQVKDGLSENKKSTDGYELNLSMTSTLTPNQLPPNQLTLNQMIQNQDHARALQFIYHRQQLVFPEALVAHFAQNLSSVLIGQSQTAPPGGKDYLPMTAELMGVFMGFGIMFANSAVVQRSGGCGGCGGGQAPARNVFLSENEVTYALAVFCFYQNIKYKQVSKYLKKHLKGFFKSALNDCASRMKTNNRSLHQSFS
ncbi:MAG: hypothetical protein HWE27_02765 [Gammaproteobacteria bacterium]|nr:hypothetical protein [Gammaproteobacteria bacterium]